MRPLDLVVTVEVFQILLQLTIGQDLFEPTPDRFTPFTLASDTFVHPIQQTIIIGAVLGPAQKLIVEIEALIVAFKHH